MVKTNQQTNKNQDSKKKSIDEVYNEWKKHNDSLMQRFAEEFSECAKELEKLNALDETIWKFDPDYIVEDSDGDAYVVFDDEDEGEDLVNYIRENGVYYIDSEDYQCIGLDFKLEKGGDIIFTYSCVFAGEGYPDASDFNGHYNFYNLWNNSPEVTYQLLRSVKYKIERLKEKL